MKSWIGLAGFVATLGCGEAPTEALAPVPSPSATPAAPIRVLLLDSKPTWQWRYVRNGLGRKPDLDLSLCLLGSELPDSLRGVAFPATREGLGAFDVILIGDVTLPGGADAQAGWLKLLGEFVRDGGGVAFLASEHMADRHRTDLDELLPVVLIPSDARAERRSTKVMPSDAAPAPALLCLEENVQPEQTFTALAPLTYLPLVQRTKPTAQALLVDREHLVDGEPAVVVAAASNQRGRTMWIGTDETWRWRDPFAERYMDAFWHNVVRFLAGRLEPTRP